MYIIINLINLTIYNYNIYYINFNNYSLTIIIDVNYLRVALNTNRAGLILFDPPRFSISISPQQRVCPSKEFFFF